MICIQQAHCYTPQDQGIQDVLIAGGQIVAMGRHLHYPDAKQIDGRGMILTPGLIDQHVHITGGGGEGGFQTRAPEIQLSALIRAGITGTLWRVSGVHAGRRIVIRYDLQWS